MFHQFHWSVVRLLGLAAFAVSLIRTDGQIPQVQACVGCLVEMVGGQAYFGCGPGTSENCATFANACVESGNCNQELE